eukprot:jgi/Phyca11/127371/e_gw1.68.177.1
MVRSYYQPTRDRARPKANPRSARNACTAELQQFLCPSNWMRSGLVDYAPVARPLQERLDSSLTGSKTAKRIAAGIKLNLTEAEVKCFNDVKDLLGNSAMLTFPDPAKQLCVLSDASDYGWGLVVTQVGQLQDDVPIHEQHHELLVCMLVCMGGGFKGYAHNWSVIEK